MAMNLPLRWNDGGKQRRAAQIPMEIWELHKSTIEELYKNEKETLADLMETMKTKHSFDATERQYTHRLRQWGISKKGKPKEQDNDFALETASGLGQGKCDESIPISCDETSESLKRPNSRQNTGSRSSQYSLDSTPASKRLKTLSEEHSDGVSSSSNEELFSEPSHITSSEDSRSIVASIASHEVMLAEGSSQNVSGSQNISPSQSSSITECEERSKPARDIEKPSRRHSQSESSWSAPRLRSYVVQLTGQKPTFQQPLSLAVEQLYKLRPGFPVEYSNLGFCLDLAHNSEGFDTLSDNFVLAIQAEEGLKVVADRLFAADHFQAASNIYSILLVAEENESTFHSKTRPHTKVPLLTPRVVAAARSARTALQCQLVQKVLRKRISLHENQAVSISELFLVHQFLADCYWKQLEYPDRMMHLVQSWEISHRLNKEGDSRLTPEHSLLLYLYYKRAFQGLPSSNVADLKDTSSRPQRLGAFGETPIGYDDFMAFWSLVRHPAQGEEAACRRDHIPDHRLLKCVRGCVAWCGSNIKVINGEVSPFKRMQYIWDAWQGEATVLHNRPRWEMVPETDLGISTSEHLHICSQIFSEIGDATRLSATSDRGLVDLYLEFLYRRISGRAVPQLGTQGISNTSSQVSLTSRSTTSLVSSNASFREFKARAESIKRRRVKVPSIDTRNSYHSGLSRRMSWISGISHLSDMFERTSILEEDETDSRSLTHGASNVGGG